MGGCRQTWDSRQQHMTSTFLAVLPGNYKYIFVFGCDSSWIFLLDNVIGVRPLSNTPLLPLCCYPQMVRYLADYIFAGRELAHNQRQLGRLLDEISKDDTVAYQVVGLPKDDRPRHLCLSSFRRLQKHLYAPELGNSCQRMGTPIRRVSYCLARNCHLVTVVVCHPCVSRNSSITQRQQRKKPKPEIPKEPR